MKCQICGSEMHEICIVKYNTIGNLSVWGEEYKQRIVICEGCDFVTTENIISSEELDFLYSEGDDYTNYSSIDLEKPNYIARVGKVKSLFNALELNFDSVLDVGASTGFLLSQFNGKTLYGVETSKAGITEAKKRYDIDLYHGTFQEWCENSNEKYDLIVAMHILEHIENINEFMSLISEHNNKYVYVEVPDLTNRLANEPYGLFAEEHLNYFSTYSLDNIFGKYQYICRAKEIDYMPEFRIANGFPMIRALYEKTDKMIGCSHIMQKPIISGTESLKKYIEWSKGAFDIIQSKINELNNMSNIVIWGASYQAEKLLAYVDFSNVNLDCIVDNSPTKWGMSTVYNTKRIFVYSPDKINWIKIDYIIISMWNNQEVVYEQIKKMGLVKKAIRLYDE